MSTRTRQRRADRPARRSRRVEGRERREMSQPTISRGSPGREHDRGGLGVDPDVVLGDGGDVALARAIPPITTNARTVRHRRVALEGRATFVSGPSVTSVICPGRASSRSARRRRRRRGAAARRSDQCRPCRRCRGTTPGGPLTGGGRPAGVTGTSTPPNLHRVQRVLHALLQRHVAADDGDRDPHAGVPQRHDQRDGVVGGGVGVDEEWAWHRRSVRSARG